MVTCVDYNATERIIVKGIFKESKAYSETSEDILKPLINRIDNVINPKNQ